MSYFDTPADIVSDVLFRADEPDDGTSDFLAAIRRALVRAHHDFSSRHPWPWLRSYPPGAFITAAPITTTLTVSAGEGVTGTLGATQATSMANRKIITGNNWFARITAHTAGSASVTLDAVPEDLTAESVQIVKDEYELAADLGLFVDGLWTEDGFFIELKSEEHLRKEFSDLPTSAWPPTAFCRLNQRRIRFSHFPSGVKRVEYPYCTAPDDIDPTSSTEFTIPHNWRWLLADATLYFAYEGKSDKRVQGAQQSYEKGVEACITYARRMMMGIGSNPGNAQRGPYE